MELGLKNKRVLITAASQGLGRAIAGALLAEGCRVVISSRCQDKLDAAALALCKTDDILPENVHAIAADVTNADDINRLVQQADSILGGIDLLITNAGGPPSGRFEDIGDDDWLGAINLNLMSVIRLIRAALPIMKGNGGGRILNISSISVKQPIPNLILSNTVRSGTMAMLKTLAQEVADDNIQIINLAPGRIKTDRVDSLDRIRAEAAGRSLQEIREKEQRNIPLGRYGTPEEFAKLAVFLLSSANSYMTGQTILADGGAFQGM